MKVLLPLIFCFALFGSACKTSKPVTSNTQNLFTQDSVWVIKYERSPCFGECPVYTFYLTEDNNGLLQAKYNYLTPGWYAADLDEESVHALLSDLEPEAWWYEDVRHLPEVPDLPGRSLVFKHKNGLRWYAAGGRVSERAEYVFGKLDDLVTNSHWSATTVRPIGLDVPEPSDVIVQLKNGVDIERWMERFDLFEIRLVRKVAPSLQYYVVTWNKDKGTANHFLQTIKKDLDVVDAQWDQALNGRSKKSDTIRE